MNGFEHGKPIISITQQTLQEQLDMIRKMSQTTRRESIAWFCYEGPDDVNEAIRKYMEKA